MPKLYTFVTMLACFGLNSPSLAGESCHVLQADAKVDVDLPSLNWGDAKPKFFILSGGKTKHPSIKAQLEQEIAVDKSLKMTLVAGPAAGMAVDKYDKFSAPYGCIVYKVTVNGKSFLTPMMKPGKAEKKDKAKKKGKAEVPEKPKDGSDEKTIYLSGEQFGIPDTNELYARTVDNCPDAKTVDEIDLSNYLKKGETKAKVKIEVAKSDAYCQMWHQGMLGSLSSDTVCPLRPVYKTHTGSGAILLYP